MIGRGCFANFWFPHYTAPPFPLPLPQKRLTPQHQSILHHAVRTSSAFLPLPSRNPRLLIHRRTRAHSLPAASTSSDLLLRPHLPLPPPLETSRLLIHHCTTAHSVSALSTAPDLLRRYSRQPQRIHSGSFLLPPETLCPHPPEPPHRRPRRRPLILFADTFLNPTRAALPTPSSTLPE